MHICMCVCIYVCVCQLLTFPSARADMTLLNERRDLLMVLASSSVSPSALVFPTYSDKHTHTYDIYMYDKHTDQTRVVQTHIQ